MWKRRPQMQVEGTLDEFGDHRVGGVEDVLISRRAADAGRVLVHGHILPHR